jgi:hypothetical protein
MHEALTKPRVEKASRPLMHAGELGSGVTVHVLGAQSPAETGAESSDTAGAAADVVIKTVEDVDAVAAVSGRLHTATTSASEVVRARRRSTSPPRDA